MGLIILTTISGCWHTAHIATHASTHTESIKVAMEKLLLLYFYRVITHSGPKENFPRSRKHFTWPEFCPECKKNEFTFFEHPRNQRIVGSLKIHQEVECEFSSVRCDGRFIREDQDKHARQNSQKHLTLTASLVASINKDFQK